MNKVILFLAFILAGGLIVTISSCTRIRAGYEGIQIYQYGSDKGVSDVSLVTGVVWYNPITQDIDEYPLYVQTVDYAKFDVNAKDGSLFKIDPTLSFSIIPTKSPMIYRKYRVSLKDISSTVMYNYVKDAFRIQMNKYSTNEIVSNRERFESDVQNVLKNFLEKEGFRLEQLTSGLEYPSVIVDAVNSKNKAVQDAMRVENELKVAEAQSKKIIIQADAENKANILRQQNLTPLLLQQKFIEKWDGSTPLYGNAPTLFKNVQ